MYHFTSSKPLEKQIELTRLQNNNNNNKNNLTTFIEIIILLTRAHENLGQMLCDKGIW